MYVAKKSKGRLYTTTDAATLEKVSFKKAITAPSFLRLNLRANRGVQMETGGLGLTPEKMERFMYVSGLKYPEVFSKALATDLLKQEIPILALFAHDFKNQDLERMLVQVIVSNGSRPRWSGVTSPPSRYPTTTTTIRGYTSPTAMSTPTLPTTFV